MQIKIGRGDVVKVSAERLPSNAEFKGYMGVVVQEVVPKTDNVLFHKEKYIQAALFFPCAVIIAWGRRDNDLQQWRAILVDTPDHAQEVATPHAWG